MEDLHDQKVCLMQEHHQILKIKMEILLYMLLLGKLQYNFFNNCFQHLNQKFFSYRFGHECLTTTLLECGASPAARNTEQRTALHLSCLAGHIEVEYSFIYIKYF